MLALSARSQHSIDKYPAFVRNIYSELVNISTIQLKLETVALTASLQQTLHILLNNGLSGLQHACSPAAEEIIHVRLRTIQ